MDQNNSCVDERWPVSSSTGFKEEEEEGDDDEALSLSDLPLIHQWRKGEDDDKNNSPSTREGVQEEFDFCSVSKESEMCAADEVFFQGQILPLRHSVSSEKGLLQHYDGRRYRSHSISRSDSMDHYYSSRSSSISSGSGSSSSASASAATVATKYKPKLPPRNQFHSHPSPSPRLHFPSSRHGGATSANPRNSIKKSSIWNVLRLGLVSTPPEIAFHDLKTRSTNCKSFGSRNSTSSNSSSISSSGGGASKIKKMRPRLLGGCKCAADVVAMRVVIIKRSASESDVVALNDEIRRENGDEGKPQSQKLTKKHLSHHRTFEWLKQLSVEGAAADEA